mmetsp:Transcript_1261/g.3355  ORF Transcript_1261/g.3355 Transcript_1261/m.3355 type:complete len:249 (+) Transcript_1261:498-1244(+)
MHGASAMDLLVSEGIGAYAIDLRGMGSTRRDPSGWTTPEQSVDDVTDVLNYLKSQNVRRPMLIGWSQGALIAQLIAQFRSEIISSVVLYGSIYNPDTEFEQGNKKGKEAPPVVMNTWEGSVSVLSVACGCLLCGGAVWGGARVTGAVAGPWRTGRCPAPSTRRRRPPSAPPPCAQTPGRCRGRASTSSTRSRPALAPRPRSRLARLMSWAASRRCGGASLTRHALCCILTPLTPTPRAGDKCSRGSCQ